MIRFIAILFACLLGSAATAQIIPPAWQPTNGWNPGVRGGIPNRTTINTTLAAGSTRTQIQNALDACTSNQVVKLSVGTYDLGTLNIKVPTGVTLRGAGISNTFVTNGSIFIDGAGGYDYDWTLKTAVNLNACVKDSSYVTSSVAHGYSVGKWVIIDQLTNGLADPPQNSVGTLGAMTWGGRPVNVGNRNMGQFCKITNIVSSTVFMVDPPLYWSYSRTPQAYEVSTVTEMAGIEDLTHIGNTADDANIMWQGGFNCWMKRVEVRGIKKKGVHLYGAAWFEISECIIHDAIPVGTDNSAQYTSDRVYSVFFGPHATAGLVTDNLIERCTMGAAFEGAAAGNVFSYNFITNIWWNNTGDSPRRFGPLNHGSHPFMNLIEGNFSSVRFRCDGYWGTSSHYTVLRNRIHQTDRGANDSQVWTMDIEKDQMYNSFFGNCLGGGGGVNEDIWEEALGDASLYSNDGHGVMWRIGALNGGGDSAAGAMDKLTWTNQLRWANWEYRTNDSVSGSGVVYITNNVLTQSYTTVTNSYYLTTAPTNFGILPWPPFGPTAPANNSVTNLPVGHRYFFGTNPPAQAAGGPDLYFQRGTPKVRGIKIKG